MNGAERRDSLGKIGLRKYGSAVRGAGVLEVERLNVNYALKRVQRVQRDFAESEKNVVENVEKVQDGCRADEGIPRINDSVGHTDHANSYRATCLTDDGDKLRERRAAEV